MAPVVALQRPVPCEANMIRQGELYADLSHYYDRFCAHIDYEAQSDFARRAYALFCGAPSRDYLDLACGSGQHLRHMLEHGFTGTGLDNSAAMLDLAKARCPTAQFELSDMAALTHVEAFDLVTCFLYSLHYSHPVSSLQQTLRGVWRALKPGGVFLCNAVDAAGVRNDAGITTELSDGDAQLRFQSAWYYRGEGEVLDLNLRITRSSPGGTQEWRDQHRMTALSIPTLKAWLEDCGFSVELLEHDYEALLPWDGQSHNVLVVALKA
jgi:Methylase involved in ubiquinone/menaquinone biosynthesis